MISLIAPSEHTGYSRDDGEDAAEDDRDDGENNASARFRVRHHFGPFTVLLMGDEGSQLYDTTCFEKNKGNIIRIGHDGSVDAGRTESTGIPVGLVQLDGRR